MSLYLLLYNDMLSQLKYGLAFNHMSCPFIQHIHQEPPWDADNPLYTNSSI